MKTALIKLMLVFVFVTNAFAGTLQLAQTGQATCYTATGDLKACAGTMQDGNIRAGVVWPNPRFSSGTGTTASCVTDALTGLSWVKNGNYPDYTYLTWEAALDYIIALNKEGGLCGYNDWRMPNIIERESLVNYDKADSVTWLNGQGFYAVKMMNYWSSTDYADDTKYAWTTDMWTGATDKDLKTGINKVWPVRAGQANITDTNYPANIWKTGQAVGDNGVYGVVWPTPRYTDNQDGAVTDNLTGLMWLKDAGCVGLAVWQDAFDKVKDFNANYRNYGCSGYKAGYNDWRLPNAKEFLSLIDYANSTQPLPITPPHPFININSPFWSATTFANKPAYAWILDMWDSARWAGNMKTDAKSYSNHIWPVRSGVVSVNNNCTATLLSSLQMNIPVIVYGNLFYAVELEYFPSTDGDVRFKVIKAEQVKDTNLYNNCQTAVLSSNYKLAIPALNYDNVSYQVNLEYVPGADANIMFKLTSAQQN